MKKLRRTLTVLITWFLSFAVVPVVWAHPLGNFTINQYVGLNVSREMILIDYVVDMAEIPAFQEITIFDANGNGQAELTESANYNAEKCTALQPDLKLLLERKPVAFALTTSSVEFPAGVGGLPTLRLTCEFQASLKSEQGNNTISFVNTAFPDRIGWSEIVVTADGVSLRGDFATTSLSHRLRNYPQDLLTNPLDERTVELEITSDVLSPQTQGMAPASQMESLLQSSLQDRNDAFTRLILMDDITLPTFMIALAVAFIWGAMHAMTPGHGKTIVGAYLVGSRGTPKHALYLGLTTTITHTLGVFLFGLITLFAAQYIVPETLFPWMTLLSGLFVVGIGLNLFIERFRASGMGSWLERLKSNRVKSVQIYSALQHKHATALHAAHKYVLTLPQERHHSHYFEDHPHRNEIHAHTHAHPHHDHDHHHGHSHSHNAHSHLPPEPETVTWRSLLALGISGGLLPCPSALVVLLGAIALNRIGLGLVLVFAFSLGLAGALTVIGLAFLYAGKVLERFPSQGRLINILPAFSALFISLIGLGIVVKALGEIGVV